MTHLLIAFFAVFILSGDPATRPQVSADDAKKANERMAEGWKMWQQQQYDASAELFQQAVDLDPTDANAWNGLGWGKFNGGDPESAETAFKKCVELEPKHAAGLNGLGQVYLMQGKLDLAEEWLLKAAPAAPAAWHGLARLYVFEEKWDDAEKWINKILSNKQAYGGEALLKQMQQACKDRTLDDGLRAQLALQGSTPAQQQLQHGFKLWQSGKMAEARKEIEAAYEQAPDDPVVINGFAWWQMNTGSPGEAQGLFEKLLEKTPSDVSAQNGLAGCYKQQGKIDDAIELWKKLLEANPSFTNASYSLADAYLDKNEFEKALPIFEKLAKELPDNDAVQRGLARAREGAKQRPGLSRRHYARPREISAPRVDFSFNILGVTSVSPLAVRIRTSLMGAGDNDSRTMFDRLVVEHIPAAMRFAIRLTDDVHLAEDIVHDALLRAARARDAFRGEAKFSTWLFQIVVNVFRDRCSGMRLTETLDERTEARSISPQHAAAALEFGEIVARHVSNLPPRQREVLVLIAYESLSIPDAAGVLGITEQNVRTTLHYAREQMRKKLAPYVNEKTLER